MLKHTPLPGEGERAMSEHTPGPWRSRGTLGPQSSRSPGPYIVESAERAICSTFGIAAGPVDRANAKLIAAAPTMLGILQRLWDQGMWTDVSTGIGMSPELTPAGEELKAFITRRNKGDDV